MRVTPDGEAIAYGRLRQRQRRVPRSRSVSPGDGLAAFLFGGSPRIRKRQDSAPSRELSIAL
jgi:hypothetical protein